MIKFRLSINLKIFLGILSILISVGFIGYNVFNITNIKNNIHHEFISSYEFTGHVKDLRSDLLKLPALIYEYNLNITDDGGRQYSRILSDIDNKLNVMSDSVTEDNQKVVISDLKKIMKGFPSKLEDRKILENDDAKILKNSEIENDKVENYDTDNNDGEIDSFVGEHILEHSELLDKFISKVEEDNAIEVNLLNQETAEQQEKLLLWIVFGTALCSTMALITALIMALSVTKPLKKIIKVIDDISKGNLSTEINNKTLKTNDEIGDLARAFERTSISLKLAMKKKKE